MAAVNIRAYEKRVEKLEAEYKEKLASLAREVRNDLVAPVCRAYGLEFESGETSYDFSRGERSVRAGSRREGGWGAETHADLAGAEHRDARRDAPRYVRRGCPGPDEAQEREEEVMFMPWSSVLLLTASLMAVPGLALACILLWAKIEARSPKSVSTTSPRRIREKDRAKHSTRLDRRRAEYRIEITDPYPTLRLVPPLSGTMAVGDRRHGDLSLQPKIDPRSWSSTRPFNDFAADSPPQREETAMKNKRLQKIVDDVQTVLDKVAGDKSVSRAEYREFLEEVSTGVEASLDALKGDERRDAELDRG